MPLSAGFSRTVIDPALGVGIDGYFIVRKTEGYLDHLEINGLALELDGEKYLIMRQSDVLAVIK